LVDRRLELRCGDFFVLRQLIRSCAAGLALAGAGDAGWGRSVYCRVVGLGLWSADGSIARRGLAR